MELSGRTPQPWPQLRPLWSCGLLPASAHTGKQAAVAAASVCAASPGRISASTVVVNGLEALKENFEPSSEYQSIFMSEVLGGIGGSYQLDPGVNADGDGIHRLHIVPPMSGDIKHLNRKERKMS